MLTAVALFSEGNLDSGVREDRADRWVLVAFAILGILLSYLPALTDRRDVWTIDGDTVRWFGVVIFTVGGALRLWPVFVLGRRFSGLVAIQRGHTLVTTGIYRFTRNPMYVGLFFVLLAWAVFLSSAWALVGPVAFMQYINRFQIVPEERVLATMFGATYAEYKARVRRWL